MNEQFQKSAPNLPSESEGFSVNPLQVFLRRWPLLALGLVVGAVIGAVLYTTTLPTFQSSAMILVLKKRTEVFSGGDVRVGVVEDYVATQVTLIRSEKIRRSVARELRSVRLNQRLPDDELAAANALSGGLTVARENTGQSGSNQAGSGVLILTYRGGDSSDCKKIVDAFVKVYQNELYALFDQASTERIKSLDKAADIIKDQRKEAAEAKLKSQAELRVITNEEVASVRSRVSAARSRVYDLEFELVDLKAQQKLIESAGVDRKTRASVLARLTAQQPGEAKAPSRPEPSAAETALRSLIAKRKELDQELGKDHPQMKAIDSQIAYYQSELGRKPSEVPVEPLANLDELGIYTLRVNHKLSTTEKQVEDLKGRLKIDEDKLLQSGTIQDRIDLLTAQVQQSDREIARLESEKLTVQATQGSGGYTAQEITPAADGGKIGPVLMQSLMMGLAIGLLLGGATMLLAEFADQSFRSPAELRRKLGLTILGHVPHIRSLPATDGISLPNLDQSLPTALRPKSVEAEAYRGLRTQLFFNIQGRGHQVIQITSPSPGDGKSTLAANLAVAIAQSGKTCVLIDADFRKPRIHRLFGIENPQKGFSSVLAGSASLADSRFSSGVPNLTLIPCGPRPNNPAELFLTPAFKDSIDQLRSEYDFVLIDTPPVLAVSDPATVAPRADGVILVLRMTKKARQTSLRAREQLTAIGANLLGVVVNGWAGGSRGGYGDYNYGHYRGYRYSDYHYADTYTENARDKT